MRLRKQANKVGYPRFKGKFRYDIFTYPQFGFKLEKGQLKLSGIGLVNIRLHSQIKKPRKLPSSEQIKTCSIISKNGKHYASFSCEVETKSLPKTGKKVGIDLGLTSFLATSDGKLYESPKTYRKAEKELVKSQKRVSRRI